MLFIAKATIGVNKTTQKISKYFFLFLLLYHTTYMFPCSQRFWLDVLFQFPYMHCGQQHVWALHTHTLCLWCGPWASTCSPVFTSFFAHGNKRCFIKYNSQISTTDLRFFPQTLSKVYPVISAYSSLRIASCLQPGIWK